MKIVDTEYSIQDVSRVLTVPDCNVTGPNKLGTGHGEAKFYIGSKEELERFSQGRDILDCFFLKTDLLTYMQAAQKEYMKPSQNYVGKDKMPVLWAERVTAIQQLPEIISFQVSIQNQIVGPRGYINSQDEGYSLFRKLSLPLISYISIMRLSHPDGKIVFYWKLFVDFDAISQQGLVPQVFTYGRGENKEPSTTQEKQPDTVPIKTAGRDASAQARYREKLLEECPFCPITKISDERLLIASHIKPFAVSDEQEAFDHKNGFMLSPLYDKLFDQGFISFDANKCMMVSNWLSPSNQNHCNIKNGIFIQMLPVDEQREKYLQYHRQFVFKG